METAFVSGGKAVRVQLDLEEGWRELRGSYGVSATEYLDFILDYRLRVSVDVIAFPKSPEVHELASAFIPVPHAEGGSPSFRYSLRGAALEIFVDLRQELDWLKKASKPGIFGTFQIPTGTPVTYDLKILLVFTPPRGAPPPTYRVWNRIFASAGLPGLGKRR